MNPIGGYFEFELPEKTNNYHENALHFQSARGAFLALLQHTKPRCVWIPWYICHSMLEPPAMQGCLVKRYSISKDLMPTHLPELSENELFIYVNYFGLCTDQIDQLIKLGMGKNLVIDNSQAFYASPKREVVATIYSPRKHFGLPDGGLLSTSLPISPPKDQDQGSIERIRPLLIRLGDGAEAGYDAVKLARATLKGLPPLQMSTLTRKLLLHLDVENARQQRNSNFSVLHTSLAGKNLFPILFKDINGPLCYPFWSTTKGLYEWLIKNKIFAARYWPEIRGESDRESDLEFHLSQECIALPCDQRYHKTEMLYISSLIDEFFSTRQINF